jgi:hypothetical protein
MALASQSRKQTLLPRGLKFARHSVGAACLLCAFTVAADPAELRIGVATADITPPLGVPLAGYYHERGADGVLDHLFSKAMIIEENGERAALVTLDLIGVTRWVTDQARRQIEQQSGIPGDHIMISATHAHTGPELANRGKPGAELGSETESVVHYTEQLPGRIANSVQAAMERLQPAQLSVARGHCENLSFNRRYFMRDGTIGWNPGKLNPDIVMPAGPTDPEVGILYVEPAGAAGEPIKAIATYVNFAMHPDTTGGTKISADWPGALRRVLNTYHGPDHLTLVANGTCGNLNHLDVSWNWPSGGPGEQNRIGTILGAAVFQAYKSLRPVTTGALRARSTIVQLELPPLSAEQIADAKKVVETTHDDRGTNFLRLVRAHRVLDIASRIGQPHQVEVQVISLGKDLAWVALPGEIFVELGLQLKKRSPFAQTFIAELANENLGYVPDRRSFAEGNYEPASSRCVPGAGEKLVEAAVELLKANYVEQGS